MFVCLLDDKTTANGSSIGTVGSNGTNRQIVYARPSGVNICSLQID